MITGTRNLLPPDLMLMLTESIATHSTMSIVIIIIIIIIIIIVIIN